jgi:MFS family permease
MDAVVADVVSKERRSEAYGGMRAVANLGWALGPALGGFIVGAGYYILFLVTGALVFVSTAIARFKLKETVPTRHQAQTLPDFHVIRDDAVLKRFLVALLAMTLVRGQFIATLTVHCSSNLGISKSAIGL